MIAVAKIDLPYVQVFKDRFGKPRHYYRRAGYPRVALPGQVGSREFLEAYATANAWERPDKITEITPGTLSHLLAKYYRHSTFTKKRASTQKAYKNQLERFRQAHGQKRVAKIEAKHLEAIFEEMAETPAQAANLRKRLRFIFKLAVKWGMRPDNPVRETDTPEYKVTGFLPWSDEDMAAFEKHWPSGSRERLAYALLRYTGIRRSDAVKAGRQHVRNGRLYVTQTKTETDISIQILPELQAEIDAAGPGMTFLVTQYGAPFTPAGFTQWFRERAEMAGLVGKTPHGLRKALARHVAEGGASDRGIAAVLGQQSTSEVGTYTKSADQRILADAAMAGIKRPK